MSVGNGGRPIRKLAKALAVLSPETWERVKQEMAAAGFGTVAEALEAIRQEGMEATA